MKTLLKENRNLLRMKRYILSFVLFLITVVFANGQTVCTSSAVGTTGLDITNISFGTINNTTALVSLAGSQGTATGAEGMYSDWKSSTVPVPSFMQGTIPTLSVTFEWDMYATVGRVDVYIDFNHDGDFTISNESFPICPYEFFSATSNTTTANIPIPLSALTGNTIMRVVCIEEAFTYPCGNYWLGETEDYLINIIAAPLCSGTPTGGTTTASTLFGCSGNTGEISVTGSYAVSGLTYQWYSSPAAGGPWAPITGATGETYLPTTFGLYFLREVVCTSSGLSSNSSSFLYNSSAPFNDECANATTLTVNPSTICSAVTPGTVACASASSEANLCYTFPNDDVWFQFVATSNTHIISIINAAGSTTDMSYAVFSGACGSLTNITCSPEEESLLTNLIIGHTYFVRVWTSIEGMGQTTTFDVCVTTIPPSPVQAPCTNLGFESGFTGWYGTAGHSVDGAAGTTTPIYVPDVFNTTSTTQHTIMTGGTDPYGLFPVVYSGNSSLRLGEEIVLTSGYNAGTIEQTFSVTAANTDFSYSYAVVLNDGGHDDAIQPYFAVGVYDQTGAEITCSMYLMVAPGTGYIQSSVPTSYGIVYYKPWSTVSVNLTSYIGQNVTIRIIASDCSWQGHFGYAYIDCACAPFEINTTPNPAVICSGEPATLTAPSGALSYSWSTGESTQSIAVYPANTTTYTCNMTTSGITPCPAELSTTVTVNASITPTFTQLGPYCLGATTDILPTTSNNGLPGTWNAAISTTTAGTSTYTFTPTAGQCATTTTITITVNANVTPTFTQLGPYCLGASPDILPTTSNNGITGTWNAAISTTTAGTSTYTFTPIAGQCAMTTTMTVTVNANVTPTFTQLGPYCAGATPDILPAISNNSIAGTWSPAIIDNLSSGTYTFTPNAGECATIQTLNVTVNQTPALTLVSTVCSTDMLTYTATFTSTTGTITASSGTVSGSTITGITAGTDITMTSTYNGCVTTIDVAAPNCACPTINPPTNPNNPSICEGATTPALTVDAAAAGYQINWYALSSGGAALATNSNSYTPNDITAGTYTYYAETEETVSGCKSIRTAVALTINSNPTASATGTDELCFGGSTGSIDLSVSGGTPNYVFDWSNGPTTEDLTGIVSGVYSVTITDANGCKSLTSVSIDEPAQIVATSAATAIQCNGGASVVTIAATGGTGLYSGTGTYMEIAGTYNFTVTDANGCAIQTTVIISEPEILTASVTASTDQNFSTPGSATIEGAGGTTPYVYTWPAGAAGVTAGTATSLIAGLYDVTVTDANGCIATVGVTIGQVLNSLTITASPVDASCGVSNGYATTTVTGGTAPYSYLWSTTPAQTTPDLQNVSNGDYEVTVTDLNGGTTSASVIIGELSGPVVSVSSQNDACRQGNGTATAIASGGDGIYTYLWSSNPPQTNANATGLAAGDYTVTVYSGMCSATATVTVNSMPGPNANISLSPSMVNIMDGPVDFSGNSSDNIVDWQWSFGDGSSGNGQTVQYQYENIGTFIVTLIVTDDNGCTYTVTDSVIVKDIFTLYIPNAFSPDNDGTNDLFMPQGLNVDPDSYAMQIFDRWGNLIFETNTWGEGWNGTKYNLGSWEDAVQGAYVYKITAKANEAHKRLHDYVGTVVILK
jgi:gliding motility-associated-like protein